MVSMCKYLRFVSGLSVCEIGEVTDEFDIPNDCLGKSVNWQINVERNS